MAPREHPRGMANTLRPSFPLGYQAASLCSARNTMT